MKVLIFTETKVGEGHYQAAKALKQALLDEQATLQIELRSGLRTLHPFIEWLSVKTYFFILKYIPKLWGWMYTQAPNSSFFYEFFLFLRLKKVLADVQAELVLCTHPMCIRMLAKLKRSCSKPFTLCAVSTDFDFHPNFVAREVDMYFVASRSALDKLSQRYAIPLSRIFITGIPIRKNFEKSKPITFKHRAGKKTNVLIMGGSVGLGPIEKVLRQFVTKQEYFHLMVLTGKNQKLKKKIQKNFPFVHTIGYVEKIHHWLQCADIIISKPGGLTVSEALALKKPLIIVSAIPGHEEANQRYLLENGLAVSLAIETMAESILQIPKEKWNKIEESIEGLQQKNAAKTIAQRVLSMT